MTEHYVYGVHAVNALLLNVHRTTKKIFVNEDREDSRIQKILQHALQSQIPLEKLSMQQLNQRFSGFVHQGIVAQASALPEYNETHLGALLQACKKPCLILILDGITDPHNLGACLRSADATAVDFVVIPKDKNASITPVVSKVACGAAECIPLVRVTNLARSMELLKNEGVWIYGAAGEATTSLYDTDCRGNVAIVMGAEGEGLRRLTRERCDALFFLPMLGSVSSLNVSVATGVSLFEIQKQRVGSSLHE